MQLLDKVKSNILLCGIELCFNGDAVPSKIDGFQPFFNSIFIDSDFHKTYTSPVSINFDEENEDSKSGYYYKQKVTFRFPNSDKDRANRVDLMTQIKFVKIKQTNGLDIVVGRNDFYQNSAPKIKIKSNEDLTEVSVESSSIYPTGYTPNTSGFGLPTLIPVTLY